MTDNELDHMADWDNIPAEKTGAHVSSIIEVLNKWLATATPEQRSRMREETAKYHNVGPTFVEYFGAETMLEDDVVRLTLLIKERNPLVDNDLLDRNEKSILEFIVKHSQDLSVELMLKAFVTCGYTISLADNDCDGRWCINPDYDAAIEYAGDWYMSDVWVEDLHEACRVFALRALKYRFE